MKDDGWLRFSGQARGEEHGHVGCEALAQALVMTREMLSAAKGADWEQLLRLEEARAPLVRRQHPADIVSRAQIEQIQAYDLQLQALLGNARDAGGARQWQRAHRRSRAIAACARS
ncbi:MAG TPA: flagellar protein FliT [Rhodanobacter sp.]|nr:flagellar protein FliT [Rhodanobacter sp.]